MIRAVLRREPVVDREQYLVELAQGKTVLHLGCADAPFFRSGVLLHPRLIASAQRVVGIDADAEGVRFLREERGPGEVLLGNVEHMDKLDLPAYQFDTVIAGELLEHLPNPGRCLEGAKRMLKPGGFLVITVPTAFSLKRFLRVLGGVELVHQDHTCYFSIVTMTRLLELCGYEVRSHAYYAWWPTNGVKRLLDRIIGRPLLRLAPWLAEGLIVVASPKANDRSG